MGGIFIYDIINLYDVFFVDYINNCDVMEGLVVGDVIGDFVLESLLFVFVDDSIIGEFMLIVGNEVSGIVVVYGIIQ